MSRKPVVVTLDDVIPMWGEGVTRAEAVDDLAVSLGELFADLRAHRENMAPHLHEQLRFMEQLVALQSQEAGE